MVSPALHLLAWAVASVRGMVLERSSLTILNLVWTERANILLLPHDPQVTIQEASELPLDVRLEVARIHVVINFILVNNTLVKMCAIYQGQ